MPKRRSGLVLELGLPFDLEKLKRGAVVVVVVIYYGEHPPMRAGLGQNLLVRAFVQGLQSTGVR